MAKQRTIRKNDLAAIMQKHFRRFVMSADFVALDSGELAIRVTFLDGTKTDMGRGQNNVTSDYTNKNMAQNFGSGSTHGAMLAF